MDSPPCGPARAPDSPRAGRSYMRASASLAALSPERTAPSM